MKLGFWNRLAVVAFVIGTLGIPTWYVLSANAELHRLRQSAYETCSNAAIIRNDAAGQDVCFKQLMDEHKITLGWSHWRGALLPSAFGLAVCYVILAGIAAVGRWVWRGRPQK